MQDKDCKDDGDDDAWRALHYHEGKGANWLAGPQLT